MERRLAAVLAADVVGYSRLMGADEAGTVGQLRQVRSELLDPKIAEHSGRIVKLTGDGVLAEFPSVVNAVACAAEIQRAMQDRPIQFRIGVNLGDIILEDGDVYGDGVNVAARLESVAEPGGIAVSQSVYDHVGNRLEVTFDDRGEQQLKNIEKPVRVYDVRFEKREPPKSLAAKKEKPSIAVLPFTNMSGDPEQEYFSDGITEDIITDLSKISALSVIARNTSFTYKGRAVKVESVGKELGVAYLLEGSVRKAGTRVRVTGQLISSSDGTHLWAERFDRDLTDIFAIQDEITHAIVDELRVKLLPREQERIAKAPTDNVEAYTYYLRGRDFVHRLSKHNLQVARRMFARAVELDPQYARAYAGIADCDSHLRMIYQVDVPIDGILATAEKALSFDSNLAEAHTSRGVALSLAQRYDEARTEFEKSITLDPNLFEAHFFYARFSFQQGQTERACALYQRAAEIKPQDYQSAYFITQLYDALGRPRHERDQAARHALRLAEAELAAHPEDPRPAQLGSALLTRLGEHDRAREWIARALAIDPDDTQAQYNAACSYALLGDSEFALSLLEKCVPNFGDEARNWVRNDSDLESLRAKPRFQKLLDRAADSGGT